MPVEVRDLVLPLVGVRVIERNLKIRNVRPPAPIRTCRKKTGPGESILIGEREQAKTGARTTSAQREARSVPASAGAKTARAAGAAAR